MMFILNQEEYCEENYSLVIFEEQCPEEEEDPNNTK